MLNCSLGWTYPLRPSSTPYSGSYAAKTKRLRRTHQRQNHLQHCTPRPIPKKSKSPLVIPCKFSAVIYSERLSGAHSVARRVLPISVENKDLHSAGVSGAECQRAGTPSVNPHTPCGRAHTWSECFYHRAPRGQLRHRYITRCTRASADQLGAAARQRWPRYFGHGYKWISDRA